MKFLKKVLKNYGKVETIVTGGLRSYPAAVREIGNADRQHDGTVAQQSRKKQPFTAATTRKGNAAFS